MPLTKEENDEFVRIRYELTNLKTALEHIARQVGVEPMEDPDIPSAPAAPTLPLHLLPDEVAAGINITGDMATATRKAIEAGQSGDTTNKT